MPILGYARVSTGDQDLAGQKRRLRAAGAYRVFEDVISGKTFRCLAGRAATPPEECGGPRGYMRILD
jgi:DNA invertase Pin-like site-specific DNA recombinase